MVALTTSRRQRATPYTPRLEALGVSDYSIVNHMVLPKGFGYDPQDDYRHLHEQVQIWDVSCQRQVELRGKDAAYLAQLMTPRDLRRARPGQCLYGPVIDAGAGILNDPVILKLDEDHFWFSIADADLLLWALGLATGLRLDVAITEPDVFPLAIQGPRSATLASRVFGDEVTKLDFFGFTRADFQGHPTVVARSGFSSQDGFEIYLDRPALALDLWDALWTAGSDLGIRPGSPNLADRIETGLLSYGNEMTRQNNPLECNLERFCNLDGSVEYIGRDALLRLHAAGPTRRIRGVRFGLAPCPPCSNPWPLYAGERQVGSVTSAAWSPRFQGNVALGMLDEHYWEAGQLVEVALPDGRRTPAEVTLLPFPG